MEGKLYNMKVTVTDILNLFKFSVVTNKGDICEDLCEKDVETVLPEIGGTVVFVGSDVNNRERMAKLISRDKKKNSCYI